MGTISEIDSFLDSKETGNDLYKDCSFDWTNSVPLSEKIEDITGDPKMKKTGWDVDFTKENNILHYVDDSKKNINYLIKGLLSGFQSISLKFAKAVRSRFVQAWVEKWRNKKDNTSPLLIQVQRKKFECLPDDNPKIQGSQKTKRTLKHNLEKPFSFLNNSSIWVRLVDDKDQGENEAVIHEFDYFKEIGLYDYPTAKEYLDYNLRLQENNYLEDFGNNHGNHVTPLLYGNEVRAREVLKNNYVELDESKSKIVDVSKPDFKYLEEFHDIAFRILLLDDKIGPAVSGGGFNAINNERDGKTLKIEIKECDDCSTCKNKQCKLRTIKHLMDDGNKDSAKKSKIFEKLGGTKDYFYWKEEGIDSYFCPRLTCDFIDDEQNDISNTNIQLCRKTAKGEEPFELKIDCDKLNIQIVGVRDVRTALLLMRKYKFDMVFCDYLLDKKDNNSKERDYANQLFEFLSHEYKGEIKNEHDDARKTRLKALEQLRHDVLDNRGPIGMYWVMPITGFNQSFIQDLHQNHINLIDYKWNISNGADPITTPWQFLYHLNIFVELQLKQCVYRRDQLLRFLLYLCKDFDDRFKENNLNKYFFAFQAFMGSEYATFMRRYGNRLIVRRDAECKGDKKDNSDAQSVFASYVWKVFYRNPECRHVIELNRLIQVFLHQASSMHNDREGQQRLDEAFGQLCFFIDTNQIVRSSVEEEEDLREGQLDNALIDLRKKIDELTANLHNNQKNNT
jgi:hypothetical protein